jgi:hypothetical protein
MWTGTCEGDSEGMKQTDSSRIAWRRGGGATYVGSVSRTPDAIRLTGRDAVLGIDVALSVPIDEIAYVAVSEPAPWSDDAELCVIVGLADSEPIYLRPLGNTLLNVHQLARALGALTEAPAVLALGGRT